MAPRACCLDSNREKDVHGLKLHYCYYYLAIFAYVIWQDVELWILKPLDYGALTSGEW